MKPPGIPALDAKAECKLHEGYGHTAQTRESCRDFVEMPA